MRAHTTPRESQSEPHAPYHPQGYLPSNLAQRDQRVRDLITELRRADLTPCSDFLYASMPDGAMHASIDGVINDLAQRAGVPLDWLDVGPQQIRPSDTSESTATWEIIHPERGGGAPFGPMLNEDGGVAAPEALLFHGFNLSEGQTLVDTMDCQVRFIGDVINGRHGIVFGCYPTTELNDAVHRQGANPLTLMADILEHLLSRPLASIWHRGVPER